VDHHAKNRKGANDVDAEADHALDDGDLNLAMGDSRNRIKLGQRQIKAIAALAVASAAA
jgi:hypothetical protein